MKRGIWLTATIVLLALAAEGGISRLQTGSNSALAAAPAPIVEGILADSDGVPIANTAVTAYADTPVDDPSGTVPLEAIGTTQTDGSGYFALTSANPPAMRAEEATNGGYLNIKLIASDGTTLWMDGSARRFINGEWLETTAAGVDVPVAPVEGIGSMGAGTTRRLIRMHASASTKRLHLPRPFSVDPTACIIGRLAVGAAERRPATVGELHNWVDVDHSRLTYGQAADTDISYGTTLGAGGWRIGGTEHFGKSSSSADGQDYPSDHFAHRISEDFFFQNYLYSNSCGGQWNEEHVINWIPGQSVGADTSQYDGHCSQTLNWSALRAGGDFLRDHDNYVRFNGGVDFPIGTFGGISLDTQTGLSTSAKVRWWFGHGQTYHYLCPGLDQGQDPSVSIHNSKRIFAGL